MEKITNDLIDQLVKVQGNLKKIPEYPFCVSKQTGNKGLMMKAFAKKATLDPQQIQSDIVKDELLKSVSEEVKYTMVQDGEEKVFSVNTEVIYLPEEEDIKKYILKSPEKNSQAIMDSSLATIAMTVIAEIQNQPMDNIDDIDKKLDSVFNFSMDEDEQPLESEETIIDENFSKTLKEKELEKTQETDMPPPPIEEKKVNIELNNGNIEEKANELDEIFKDDTKPLNNNGILDVKPAIFDADDEKEIVVDKKIIPTEEKASSGLKPIFEEKKDEPVQEVESDDIEDAQKVKKPFNAKRFEKHKIAKDDKKEKKPKERKEKASKEKKERSEKVVTSKGFNIKKLLPVFVAVIVISAAFLIYSYLGTKKTDRIEQVTPVISEKKDESKPIPEERKDAVKEKMPAEEMPVTKKQEPKPIVKSVTTTPTNEVYYSVSGSYSKEEGAKNDVVKLRSMGYDAHIVSTVINSVTYYRVKVKSFGSRAQAQENVNYLKSQGFSGAFILKE